MRGLSLFWPVDAGGYSQKWVESTKETLAHAGHGYVIARAGGELVAKRDVMKVPALYSVFARWPENTKLLPKHALEFVQTYGFLRKGKHLTEFADDIIDEMKAVRHLLALRDAGKWSAITKLGTINNERIRLNPVLKSGAPPTMSFAPASLRDAIYLQFYQDLSTGAQLRHCKRPGCHEWFEYGAGTGRRNTAEYCSPKCRGQHAYQISKGEKS